MISRHGEEAYPTGKIPVTTIPGVANVTYGSKPANGDGLDPDPSKNILIEDSFFNTSNDVIAIKSGLNEDGWRVNKPCETIVTVFPFPLLSTRHLDVGAADQRTQIFLTSMTEMVTCRALCRTQGLFPLPEAARISSLAIVVTLYKGFPIYK